MAPVSMAGRLYSRSRLHLPLCSLPSLSRLLDFGISPVIAPSLNCLATGGFAPSHSKPSPSSGMPPCLYRRGVNHSNLRALRRATRVDAAPWTRMALFNIRSLVNKTFVSNDFFSTTSLDALFLTETWIRPGESLPFSELLPPDCVFFSSPRLTGRGGGLASVFNCKYKVRQLPCSSYISYEAQLLEMTASRTSLIVLVYRPPKYNKTFIHEFADLLGSVIFKYDCVLIMGDFNIHICCNDDPLAKDFLALTDSFNLAQWVNQPTHARGHTLNLFISHGLDISIKDISNVGISDHFPVIVDVNLCTSELHPDALLCPTRIINSATVEDFSMSFSKLASSIPDCSLASTIDDFASTFFSTCSSIFNTVAPVKMKHPRSFSRCWLNDSTHALRRVCRRDEKRWKKETPGFL
ncbi:uncharacterized protein LOC120744180 [Simochromis diagramma]|uniref:uncharacterized protein LOC120744180 n=1 Tax=Simochromis diagramma TaxID=43689 RepID=UPI001A7ECB7C|nr:uncharacterized protein LOC120744180 [Simochromis diagramma]